MIRKILPLGLIFVGVLFFVGAADDVSRPTLPGALVVVNAADYPTLQAALDAVSEQGGCVQLPAGTFEIDKPLAIRQGDVCLRGAGSATHIKNTNTEGLPALVIAHRQHPGGANDRDHELWRVRLSNFRITGNTQSGAGIAAYNINEIFIDGVTVSYHGGDGILLSYCYEDPRIVDSLITYNKATGLHLVGCHDIVVASNQFEENQDALRCLDGFNLCMTGNCLDDHLGRGVVIENTYGSVVAGNMIEECQAAALVLDRDCYGNTVSANVIAHNGSGIDIRDAHGCAVSANTFTIMQQDAMTIRDASSRIAVSANSFADSYIGDGRHKRTPEDQRAGGLVIDGAEGVLVGSNLFSGVKPQAIAVAEATQSAVISENLVVATNAGVPTAMVKAVTVADNRSAATAP